MLFNPLSWAMVLINPRHSFPIISSSPENLFQSQQIVTAGSDPSRNIYILQPQTNKPKNFHIPNPLFQIVKIHALQDRRVTCAPEVFFQRKKSVYLLKQIKNNFCFAKKKTNNNRRRQTTATNPLSVHTTLNQEKKIQSIIVITYCSHILHQPTDVSYEKNKQNKNTNL